MRVKEINRNIKFDTRKLDSRYRCNYGNRANFDLLRINMIFQGKVVEVYEIDSQLLPSTDSIHFKAMPTEDGFMIHSWTAKAAPHIRKVESWKGSE